MFHVLATLNISRRYYNTFSLLAHMYIFADLCIAGLFHPALYDSHAGCSIDLTIHFCSSRQNLYDFLMLKPSDQIFMNFPPTAWSPCAALTTQSFDVRKFKKRKCRHSRDARQIFIVRKSIREIFSLENLLTCRELIHWYSNWDFMDLWFDLEKIWRFEITKTFAHPRIS